MSIRLAEKLILHIDMDCVLSDFWGAVPAKEYNPSCMYNPGFFETLKPVSGALEAVRILLKSERYDIYILTQPVANSVLSYSEKASWVLKWLPELKDKIIMTQDKSLIKGDYLIDDNPKWKSFAGKLLLFNIREDPNLEWDRIIFLLLGSNNKNT